jgi:uncharacterized integral membrane protein
VTPAPDGRTPGGLELGRTRTSTTYAGLTVGLLILVLVIIFVAQNLHTATVHFLTVHFRMAEGLLILASAVAGGLIVLAVSLARVLQLRRAAHRHQRAHNP